MIYKLSAKSRVIIKFGGSSVRDSFSEALELVQKFHEGNEVVIVLSALKGVTDLLLKLAETRSPEILEELEEIHLGAIEKLGIELSIENEIKELRFILENEKRFPNRKAYVDYVLSFGERLSVKIFSKALEDEGIKSSPVDAFYLIETDGNFGNARVDLEKTKGNIWTIERLLEKGKIPVVTGFLGNFNGIRTTLGRGGSDYTASVLGYLLNARAVLIMSDVKGIYTADPRIVKNARIIPFISYEEALTASRLGMKALHERTIEPIKDRVPLILGKTSEWRLGTLVSDISFKMPIITYKTFRDTAEIGVVGAFHVDVEYPIVEHGRNFVCFLVERDNLEAALNEIHEVVLNESLSTSDDSELWTRI
ncbi:aspartate kinase [Thermococcus barophilus]|uniref:Aspartokinase n=1 Tax=Thermococcus barophilus (strain DSM 11836 / MP) TaxID=391623 RepID=F0LJC7_THEBM|nr:aspartate kinase [Thermococcus barophilus]ADT83393.1 aspartokinase [Thermococcus barophilus MP]